MLGFTCCTPFCFFVFLVLVLFIWLDFAGLVLRCWFVLVILVNSVFWLFWVNFMWVLGLWLLFLVLSGICCIAIGLVFVCLADLLVFLFWFVVEFAGCWFFWCLGEWCCVCGFKFWFDLVVDFDSLVLLCLCCFVKASFWFNLEFYLLF